MKRFIAILTLISVIAILTACSSESSLELTNKKVEITNDKGRLGSMILQQGEKAGTEAVPTALYYTFSIKNVGSKKIGDEVESLKLKIEPSEKLATVSEEVMGFNIFNPEGYNETGLGYGHTFSSILGPNEEGEFTLHYDLGIDVETTEALFVPTKEQLEKLEDNALEANLIVMLGDEEIARFDLSEKE
ncbi:hypothetical protein [Bacillus sp. S/N-304-OC-R1]|uniref:hypothetical protein n=1 Tax=Bacillus sp. S/N-304-OC-R1 TaxID=2758034 RepID=UPI001C8DFE8F|nr:hypothetical protein [Bacillus sp. S/N-304-OC-R1]MBY0121575.1 hypothetical protein [Bacillus sp. S/N-304-OC-R1]